MSNLSFRRWVGLSAAGALFLALALPATAASAATSPASAATSPASAATSSKTVTVAATQAWTDTHIYLSRGTVSFKASGTINVSSGNPAFNNTPAGQGPADPQCIGNSATPWGDDWTATGLPCWSLIGRIGNGSPFEIGDSATHAVSNPGELYLGVNDQSTSFVDNSGSWTVQASWTSSSPVSPQVKQEAKKAAADLRSDAVLLTAVAAACTRLEDPRLEAACAIPIAALVATLELTARGLDQLANDP